MAGSHQRRRAGKAMVLDAARVALEASASKRPDLVGEHAERTQKAIR